MKGSTKGFIGLIVGAVAGAAAYKYLKEKKENVDDEIIIDEDSCECDCECDCQCDGECECNEECACDGECKCESTEEKVVEAAEDVADEVTE